MKGSEREEVTKKGRTEAGRNVRKEKKMSTRNKKSMITLAMFQTIPSS
jgi:hypothetical protein